jgi:transposase InsO family protein
VLFRYGLIAPVLHGTTAGTAAAYFRRAAEEPIDLPHIGRRRIAASTLKSWLYAYRRGGIEALETRVRSDRGASRVITEEIDSRLREMLADSPRLSAQRARDLLVEQGVIQSRSPSVTTLRRYIRNAGLRVAPERSTVRRSWAKRQPNELWTLDFMHGPSIAQKTAILLAAIDDASRFIVLGRFLPAESYQQLAPCLLHAFLQYGLPKALYCDNGAPFLTKDLALAAARLDIALIHSKPYDPASRGKIERYFRTVRSRFLEPLNQNALKSLKTLNEAFSRWLDLDYHRRVHSTLERTPLEAWLDCDQPKRWVAKQQLDLVFHRTLHRKVRADGSVSINRRRYEVGAEWIGKKVELRSPLDESSTYILFSAGEPALTLRPLDPHENDRQNTRARFAKKNQELPS